MHQANPNAANKELKKELSKHHFEIGYDTNPTRSESKDQFTRK